MTETTPVHVNTGLHDQHPSLVSQPESQITNSEQRAYPPEIDRIAKTTWESGEDNKHLLSRVDKIKRRNDISSRAQRAVAKEILAITPTEMAHLTDEQIQNKVDAISDTFRGGIFRNAAANLLHSYVVREQAIESFLDPSKAELNLTALRHSLIDLVSHRIPPPSGETLTHLQTTLETAKVSRDIHGAITFEDISDEAFQQLFVGKVLAHQDFSDSKQIAQFIAQAKGGAGFEIELSALLPESIIREGKVVFIKKGTLDAVNTVKKHEAGEVYREYISELLHEIPSLPVQEQKAIEAGQRISGSTTPKIFDAIADLANRIEGGESNTSLVEHGITPRYAAENPNGVKLFALAHRLTQQRLNALANLYAGNDMSREQYQEARTRIVEDLRSTIYLENTVIALSGKENITEMVNEELLSDKVFYGDNLEHIGLEASEGLESGHFLYTKNSLEIGDITPPSPTGKRYEIISVVSSGAYGVTYQAKEVSSGQIVAIKEPLLEQGEPSPMKLLRDNTTVETFVDSIRRVDPSDQHSPDKPIDEIKHLIDLAFRQNRGFHGYINTALQRATDSNSIKTILKTISRNNKAQIDADIAAIDAYVSVIQNEQKLLKLAGNITDVAGATDDMIYMATFDKNMNQYDNYYFVLKWAGKNQLEDDLGTPWPKEEAVFFTAQLLDLLDQLHNIPLDPAFPNGPKGIVHKDIKPLNIHTRVDPATGYRVPILLDFGISKATNRDKSLTQKIGTPVYVAPEQARTNDQSVPVSDVYSTGRIFWQLLTGQDLLLPFSPLHYPQEPQLETILQRMLDPNPNKRINAADARDALYTYLQTLDPNFTPPVHGHSAHPVPNPNSPNATQVLPAMFEQLSPNVVTSFSGEMAVARSRVYPPVTNVTEMPATIIQSIQTVVNHAAGNPLETEDAIKKVADERLVQRNPNRPTDIEKYIGVTTARAIREMVQNDISVRLTNIPLPRPDWTERFQAWIDALMDSQQLADTRTGIFRDEALRDETSQFFRTIERVSREKLIKPTEAIALLNNVIPNDTADPFLRQQALFRKALTLETITEQNLDDPDPAKEHFTQTWLDSIQDTMAVIVYNPMRTQTDFPPLIIRYFTLLEKVIRSEPNPAGRAVRKTVVIDQLTKKLTPRLKIQPPKKGFWVSETVRQNLPAEVQRQTTRLAAIA